MSKSPVYWVSPAPDECDICMTPISTAFVDGSTKMGPWANMCMKCHGDYGNGFGMGRGQKYEKQADGKWLKTEG